MSETAIKDCVDCPEMVILPTDIAMGRTEVTQEQWKAVMGNNPSKFIGCGDDCPVEQVSWNDTQDFIRRLNSKTGKTYRLPTDAEWDLACRAGERRKYCGSDSIENVAWHYGNSSETHRVAGKQPNAWGLYDMSGNVAEWTESCSDEDCRRRVLRGGAWRLNAHSGNDRLGDGPSGNYSYYGFRLARMLTKGR